MLQMFLRLKRREDKKKEGKVVSFRPDDSIIPPSQVYESALSLNELCIQQHTTLQMCLNCSVNWLTSLIIMILYSLGVWRRQIYSRWCLCHSFRFLFLSILLKTIKEMFKHLENTFLIKSLAMIIIPWRYSFMCGLMFPSVFTLSLQVPSSQC